MKRVNGTGELFCVKWNNYPDTILRVFRKYLRSEMLTDITLSVDSGKSIKCHGVLLCACSTYFEEMLSKPVMAKKDSSVFFIRNMEFWELKALVTFMYFGEVQIEEEKLTQFVKAAGALKIKGLAPQQNEARQESELEDSSDTDCSPCSSSQEEECSSTPPQLATSQRPIVIPKKRKSTAQDTYGRKISAQTTGVNSRSSTRVENVSNRSFPNVACGAVGLTNNEEQVLQNNDREACGEMESDPKASDSDVPAFEKANLSTRRGTESALEGCVTLDNDLENERSPQNYEAKESLHFLSDYDFDVDTWNGEDLNNKQEEPAIGFYQPDKIDDQPSHSVSETKAAPPVKYRRGPGVSTFTGDRAERLTKAMNLALGGTTVRQAAAQLEIPRTTLCAFMKRHGVSARRSHEGGSIRRASTRNQAFQTDDDDMTDAYDEHSALLAPHFLQGPDKNDDEEGNSKNHAGA